ncbi:MAG: outer membrane lipoprotein-sorting protein [Candidatus Omnitrophica bacterium]|nr:outer membrane lipoprotein-sorting protein [Candidatus Omnitrophota bacterium]
MKTLKISLVISLLSALYLTPAVLFAEDNVTAEEIVIKSRLTFYYAGDDMRAKVLMELINKDGKKRVRELTMLRKDYEEGGDQKYFMYFHKPADVRDTTFMVYKYHDRDDDRWLFIPAINLVKRIAANDKYSSFVGSDFTYEDISGRKPEEDTHTLSRKDKLNGKNCFVIESIPKETSEYTKRISWIDEANFLPLKEEFYDKQDELYRQFEAQEVKDMDGILTITKRIMKNVKTGHRTEAAFQEVEYNLGVEDNVFSERYLRRPPLQWIR